MGWLFKQGSSKKDIIRNCTQGWVAADGKRKTECIALSCRGNNLWTVFKSTFDDERDPETYIILFMLRSDRGYGWGYKDVSESMGPYQVNCPLKYLEMAKSDVRPEWREQVRKYHAMTGVQISAGDYIRMIPSACFRGKKLGVERVQLVNKGRLFLLVDGYYVRVPRRHIESEVCRFPSVPGQGMLKEVAQ